MKGSLYLIPTILGEYSDYKQPENNQVVVQRLAYFFVERAKTARRHLRKMGFEKNFDQVEMLELNNKTKQEEIISFLQKAIEGNDIGVISEAGCPGVADPGALVVKLAHEMEIQVKPLVGPSSILLALMASGLNGQNFAFTGYLPIKQPERNKTIKKLEQRALQGQTQIFMETPYRNNKLLEDLLAVCSPNIYLCIATDISLPTETIKTQLVSKWKKDIPQLNKRPSIFLVG